MQRVEIEANQWLLEPHDHAADLFDLLDGILVPIVIGHRVLP